MANLDNDAKNTANPVLEWYSKLHSRRVDIVGDYAGNELFLIEGDSVLLHCFSDPHINFDTGFQLLHAAYTVENFLRGLVARRCNFHIAFFEEHSELCVPPWVTSNNREKYLLARAAIIRHFACNIKTTQPDIEVHVFSSIRSSEFAKYLEVTDLYFILCHDGASSSISRKRHILSNQLNALEDEGYIDDDGNDDNAKVKAAYKARVKFRHIIYWFLIQGYNAALVNGLEWRDTKVITAVLESGRHIKQDNFAQLVNLFPISCSVHFTVANLAAL
jgi:ATP-dependent RNA helicase DDX60